MYSKKSQCPMDDYTHETFIWVPTYIPLANFYYYPYNCPLYITLYALMLMPWDPYLHNDDSGVSTEFFPIVRC